ncbi:hypothetical protein CEE86_12170, partial [Lactobacillus crispatus]
ARCLHAAKAADHVPEIAAGIVRGQIGVRVRVADPSLLLPAQIGQRVVLPRRRIAEAGVGVGDAAGGGVRRVEIGLQLAHVIVVRGPREALIVVRQRNRLVARIERTVRSRRGVDRVVALLQLELITGRV